MNGHFPDPALRMRVRLRLWPQVDPRLLATLNRFHFLKILLVLDEAGPFAPGAAGSEHSASIDLAWVRDHLDALWSCYAPYLEGQGWLPNKSIAEGGQGKSLRADQLAMELEAGLCRAMGTDPPSSSGGFALALTHDVDVVGSSALATLKSGLVFAMNALRSRGRPGATDFFLGMAARFLSGRVDYYGFAHILAIARAKAFRPVFFLFARLPGHNGLSRWQRLAGLNPNYDLQWAELGRALEDIRQSGAQVGLHGSFLSAERPELLAAEKRALEMAAGLPCRASRQHFLHLKRETSLDGAHACGMLVDSTCGYVYDNGLYCGTVRPFYAVAPDGDDPGLVVVPMIFMDAVPLYFRPAAPGEVRRELAGLVELMREKGGFAAINFHQRMISCIPEYRELYQDLVGMTRQAGGRVLALDELDLLYPTPEQSGPL